MTPCIISLVHAALAYAGRDEALMAELDQHAAVELSFPNIPNIVIEKSDDEDIVLYCNLNQNADALRDMSASHILALVATKAPWARNHCVSLLDEQGDLYLTAVVANQCLQDGEGFSTAIDGFYQRVCGLCKVEL